MKLKIVLGCLLSLLADQGTSTESPDSKIVQIRSYDGGYQDYENYAPMPYSFSYSVLHPRSFNNFGHQESSDGRVVVGSYYVALPDGRLQTVNYKDEGYGFLAQVHYDGEAHYGPGPLYTGAPSYRPVKPLSEAELTALIEAMAEAEPPAKSEPEPQAGPEPDAESGAEPQSNPEPLQPIEEPAQPIDEPVEVQEEHLTTGRLNSDQEPPTYHPVVPYRDIYAKYRQPYAPQPYAEPYVAQSPYGPYDRYAKYRVQPAYPYEGADPYGYVDPNQAVSPYGPYDRYASYRHLPNSAKYQQPKNIYNGETYPLRQKRKNPNRQKRRQAKRAKMAAKAAKRANLSGV